MPNMFHRLDARRSALASCVAACLLACTAITLSSCTGPTALSDSKPPRDGINAPKLVVLLAIDGLPYRQMIDHQLQFVDGGFLRLMNRGAWFENAHHGHARTVTAAGHAAMLTGTHPNKNGIIANDWRNADTGEPEYCTGDVRATYIGHTTKPLDGTSPKNLLVQTVGDMLKLAQPGAKVIAVSGKDRGAILPAGQLGTAYMYMDASGQFASSTHYMPKHPDWVDAFNAQKPADGYFGQQWKALLEDSQYGRSLPDTQKWFRKPVALPITMGVAGDPVGPAFYSALRVSPFLDELTLKFAKAAISGERLGVRGVTDVLSISLSGHDYVNHSFSAESRLSHDHLLHLDRMLARFFKDLNADVGADNYLLALTSDHGFMPAPERSAELGVRSGRFSSPAILKRVNESLAAQFGPGPWVTLSDYALLINKKLLRAPSAPSLAPLSATSATSAASAPTIAGGADRSTISPPNFQAVANAARDALMSEPGIAAAYTRQELQSGSRNAEPFFESVQKTWHARVSGDVQFIPKAHWMGGANVATHGSPHGYDTHVPLAFYGPYWANAFRSGQKVAIVDLAPTLASAMGIDAPNTSEGKVLTLKP